MSLQQFSNPDLLPAAAAAGGAARPCQHPTIHTRRSR